MATAHKPAHRPEGSPEVKVGQVWKDCDKRIAGRHIRIVSLGKDPRRGVPIAVGEHCKPDGSALYKARTTTVAVERMFPHACGWTLVKECTP